MSNSAYPDATLIETDQYEFIEGLDSYVETSFTKSIYVRNSTGRSLYLIDRSGISPMVRSVTSSDLGIYIKLSMTLGKGGIWDDGAVFLNREGQQTLMGQRIAAIIKDLMVYNRTGALAGQTLEVSMRLDSRKIPKGKVLYLRDLDLAVTDVNEEITRIHPYSICKLTAAELADEIHIRTTPRLISSMYIVDNDNDTGDRYTFIHGVVCRIPRIKNQSLPSGVYICTPNGPDVVHKTVDVDFTHRPEGFYTHAEALEHGLIYEYAEDAKVRGDHVKYIEHQTRRVVAENNLKTAETKNESTIEDRSWDREKRYYTKEDYARQLELSELKHQQVKTTEKTKFMELIGKYWQQILSISTIVLTVVAKILQAKAGTPA